MCSDARAFERGCLHTILLYELGLPTEHPLKPPTDKQRRATRFTPKREMTLVQYKHNEARLEDCCKILFLLTLVFLSKNVSHAVDVP